MKFKNCCNPEQDYGNMLTRAKDNYTWDAESRLLVASNLTTAVVCNFIYDHHSRRISKTTLTPNPFNSLTSNFTYDGWNLIQETTLNSQFSITQPAVQITQLSNARGKIPHITQAQFGSLSACNAQAGGAAGLA